MNRQAVLVRMLLASGMERTAKPKYLKAIDFTLGLMRRLDSMGIKPADTSPQEIIQRLIQLRQLAQTGIRLDNLAENWGIVQGAGERLLAKVEAKERELVPKQKDFAAFIKPYPDKADRALEAQERRLTRTISVALEVPQESVRARVMSDRAFMEEAYAACRSEISGVAFGVVRQMSKFANMGNARFEHRLKNPKSIWGKQGRANTPFMRMGDLLGCRATADNLAGMCAIARPVQAVFAPVSKRNAYQTMGDYYNGINYKLSADGFVYEFQLKAEANRIEAALTHDLIYADEKAVLKLSDAEKSLVKLVFDVSTQLSMREWAEIAELGEKALAIRKAAAIQAAALRRN